MRKIIDRLKWFYINGITKQLKISFIALALLLGCYTVLRFGFFLTNHEFYKDASALDVIKAFIYGIRFDFSALLMLNGILLLAYNIPGNIARWKAVRIIFVILFFTANLAFIITNLSDYVYFPTVQRRVTLEFFTMPGEIFKIIPTFFAEYYYLFFALAISGTLFVIFGIKLLRKLNTVINYEFRLWREIGCFIFLALVIIYGVKGGIQRKPIRPVHAFFSTNRAIGNLTLNSTFTVIKSIFQASLPKMNFMPEREAKELLREMLYEDNEEIIDPEYPFLRKKVFNGQPQKMNVVIFLMESWTADFIGAVGGEKSYTPFFDSLALSGTLLTNFMATGHRSVVAASSVIGSIPGFYSMSTAGKQNSFIESQSESNSFIGLGNILSKNGYTTSCHHGANIGALGLDAYSKLAGFKHYFGREDYLKLIGKTNKSTGDDIWGAWDEEFFQDMIIRMDGFKEPFCSIVLSLTSHEPFTLPPHRENMFQKYTQDNKYQKALRYSDFALEEFFKTARSKPWFKNTIFIITADHTSHSIVNNFYSLFHIPLLIYSPENITPGKINHIGSQVDIIPTILDLLKISASHSSMGSSLLNKTKPHYAVVTDGTQYAILSDKFALVNDLEKSIGFYDYHTDPFFKNDLSKSYPDAVKSLQLKLYAYIQEVTNSIADNKVCRGSDLK